MKTKIIVKIYSIRCDILIIDTNIETRLLVIEQVIELIKLEIYLISWCYFF